MQKPRPSSQVLPGPGPEGKQRCYGPGPRAKEEPPLNTGFPSDQQFQRWFSGDTVLRDLISSGRRLETGEALKISVPEAERKREGLQPRRRRKGELQRRTL